MELLISLVFGNYARVEGDKVVRQMHGSHDNPPEERLPPILWDRVAELRADRTGCTAVLKPTASAESIGPAKRAGCTAPIAALAWITPTRCRWDSAG